MLTEIGIDRQRPGLHRVGQGGPGGRLQGFGHRVYKSYDPRAKIIKRTADEVFAVTGKNPLLDIALKLEEIALSRRVLHLAQALPERRLLLRASSTRPWGSRSRCSRSCSPSPAPPGWLAHWQEMLDQDSKIARPRQLFVGSPRRDDVPMSSAARRLTIRRR